MGRVRSLVSQTKYATGKNFEEKIDKRADKIANGEGMTAKIYSYKMKDKLNSRMKSFQIYAKENNLLFKYITDIKAEYIQDYLNKMKERGVTQGTLETAGREFYKLEKVFERTYRKDLSWRNEIAIPKTERKLSNSRGVNRAIRRVDYNKILNYATENISQSGAAIKMQNWLGVRVEEIARVKKEYINLENRTITFKNTKGGKEFTREIPRDQVDFVKEIIEKNYDDERLLSVNGGSINKYLSRVEEQLEIEKHSNHDIRRLIAQEKFDGLREQGKTIEKAVDETSKWLNHGEGRQAMLERSYIKLR